MGNGSGMSRGDRNRNACLARLRVLVPVTNAIAGIDLADKKQMVVVTDHDSTPSRAIRVGLLLCDLAAVPAQDGAGCDQPVRPQLMRQEPD
jgi:hypothetical protein